MTDIKELIRRAWDDDAFKEKLKSDPKSALAEVGISVPDEITIKVVESSADTHYLVLPGTPADAGYASSDEFKEEHGL